MDTSCLKFQGFKEKEQTADCSPR